jgi:hypothetical protein
VVVCRFSRGDVLRPQALSIIAVGSISGISSAGGGGYLIGVFLADTVPTGPPPATLDFTSDRDFVSLSPEPVQTFFIGDGRTATGRPHSVPSAARSHALVLRARGRLVFPGSAGLLRG